MAHKKLGDLLVKRGTLTDKQLNDALKKSVDAGVPFPDYVLEHKLVSDQDLAQAYAEYVSVDYLARITDKIADPTLLAKIPLTFLRENVVMPVNIEGRTVILTANPLKFQPVDELNLLLGGQTESAVATKATIVDGINRYYPLEGTKQMIEELAEEDELAGAVDLMQIEEKDILAMATEAPIIKLVNHILFQAVKRDASDIHIEPFEKELNVRYRIDGVLHQIMMPPKRVQGALISRIKIMANMNIAEKRQPQDNRIHIQVAGKAFDIRVSVLPVAFGERVVMRILDKTKTFGALDVLGFSPRDLKMINDSISRPNGILFITGPTGSGKTSTLYSILGKLNVPEVNIVTVEDPIEYQMNGIGQVQVREKIGLTFAASLRSILRQDPDIVMIGETRDLETAQIAVQAALTGHLVLSTLHTNSAPATITRLIDMGIEPFLIASTIIGAVAQRLVRKLCGHCKKEYKPTPEAVVPFGLNSKEAKEIKFYRATGCEECMNTGYKGRLAVFEIMMLSDALGRLIMERADTNVITKQARKDGMTTLLDDGLRKIKAGATTIEEVLSVASMQQELVE